MEYVVQSIAWGFTFYKNTVILPYESKTYVIDDQTEEDLGTLKKLVKGLKIKVKPSIAEIEGFLQPKIDLVDSTTNLVVESNENMLQVNEEGKLFVKNVSTDLENLKATIDKYKTETLYLLNQYESDLKTVQGSFQNETQLHIQNIKEDMMHMEEAISNKKHFKFYNNKNEVTEPIKIFSDTVSTLSEGSWTVDYSHMAYKTILSVTVNALNNGTTAAGRRIASIASYSTTSLSGSLMGATSIGLLAAMSLSAVEGQVLVTVVGT